MTWLTVLTNVLPILMYFMVLAEDDHGSGTGDLKRAEVVTAMKMLIQAWGSVSTGKQKESWEKFAPVVIALIDLLVPLLFPKGK